MKPQRQAKSNQALKNIQQEEGLAERREAAGNLSGKAEKDHFFVWRPNKDAKEVCVAGDFSNWTPIPMMRRSGNFQISIKLVPGKHQYKFIVDGQWQNDPESHESAPNGFNGTNSVVHVR